MERLRLVLAQSHSPHRSCAWSVGGRSSVYAPVLSNRSRRRQLIYECPRSVARPKRFRDPLHRETWSRLAAICGTSHTGMRKVSCHAPASPPGLRNTVPIDQTQVRCGDLPCPMSPKDHLCKVIGKDVRFGPKADIGAGRQNGSGPPSSLKSTAATRTFAHAATTRKLVARERSLHESQHFGTDAQLD